MRHRPRSPLSRVSRVWALAAALLFGAFPVHAQRVTGVSPGTVVLTAGETGVQVDVRGAFPPSLERVEIRDLGRVMRDLSGSILRSGQGRIVIELSATARARSARGLEVFLIGRDRSELRVPVELEVVEAMAPAAATEAATLTHQAGSFLIHLAPPPESTTLEPVQLNIGTFLLSVAPDPTSTAPDPVTHQVGTFQITLSPAPGGES